MSQTFMAHSFIPALIYVLNIVHTHTRGRGRGSTKCVRPILKLTIFLCEMGTRREGGGGGIFDILRTYYLNASFWIFTFSQKSPLYSIFHSSGKSH